MPYPHRDAKCNLSHGIRIRPYVVLMGQGSNKQEASQEKVNKNLKYLIF